MRKRWPKMWMYVYSQVNSHPLGQALQVACLLAEQDMRPYLKYTYRDLVMRRMVALKAEGKTFEEASKEVLAYWVGRRFEGK